MRLKDFSILLVDDEPVLLMSCASGCRGLQAMCMAQLMVCRRFESRLLPSL